MALRAVPDHPKFACLKAALRMPKGATAGWLEMTWHFAGRFTPHGNIGKYTDAQIESWVEWDGEPGALIAALIDTGWLDRSAEHRLIVHDWHVHADNATKLSVKRSGKPFCTDSVDTVSQQCGDTVSESVTPLGLPVPEPVPEPEPVPGPGAGPEEKQIPPSPSAPPCDAARLDPRPEPADKPQLPQPSAEAGLSLVKPKRGRRADSTKPYHPRFESAYERYPKHEEKSESQAEWTIAVTRLTNGERGSPPRTQDEAWEFLEGASADYAAKMTGRESQHIRSMRRWLHGSTYLDYPGARRKPEYRVLTEDEAAEQWQRDFGTHA